MSSCRVVFDNLPIPGYTGTAICGQVVCNFNSQKNVRSIKVRLKCIEHTEWMTTERHYDSIQKRHISRHVRLTGHRRLHFSEIILYQGGNDTMSPGSHIFPFSFSIPKDLPSSFEGKYGYIRYKIKAVVDRPMKTDFKDTVSFPIVSLIDCRSFSPELMQPTGFSYDKYVGCCCCQSGPITLKMEMSKGTYALGEIMNVKLDVTNLSNQNVESVQLTLKQKIQYKVECPRTEYRNESTQLCSASDTGVGAHGTREYGMKMQIPTDIIIPNFKISDLFSVSYKFTATCTLKGMHSNLEINTYLEMGHLRLPDELPPNVRYTPTIGNYPNTNSLPPYSPPGIGFQPTADGEVPGMSMPQLPISATKLVSSKEMPSAPPEESETVPSTSYGSPPPSYEEANTNRKSAPYPPP